MKKWLAGLWNSVPRWNLFYLSAWSAAFNHDCFHKLEIGVCGKSTLHTRATGCGPSDSPIPFTSVLPASLEEQKSLNGAILFLNLKLLWIAESQSEQEMLTLMHGLFLSRPFCHFCIYTRWFFLFPWKAFQLLSLNNRLHPCKTRLWGAFYSFLSNASLL